MDDGDLRDDLLNGDVEPGSPSAENALFVLLGVISTLAVILRLAAVV